MPRGVRCEDPNGKGGTNPATGKVRLRFGRGEDYLLAIEVKDKAPYKARHGAIGGAWDAVAERLNQHPDFHMRSIKGTTAKARLETIVTYHRLWMEKANSEKPDDVDSPYRRIMTELVKEIDVYATSNSKGVKGEAGHDKAEVNGKDSRSRSRLGKRRASGAPVDTEPKRRELPRAIDTEQTQMQPGDSVETLDAQVTKATKAPALLEKPVMDFVTFQQALGELIKLQQAYAVQPSKLHVVELEKINQARLREEEEKTKQCGFELQIEIQRTKRRQLELDFEREERRKDREEQAKLIASLLERLDPKKK